MIIAIDCGKTGCIVKLYPNEQSHSKYEKMEIQAFKMPLNDKQLDCKEIISLIRDANIIYLEKQQAMSKQGVTSTFTTGMNYGILQGIIAALEIPVIITSSQKWKAKYSLKTGNKEDVLAVASRLYPELELPKKSKAFAISICDALLMTMMR
jgi:hypothetical protein